MLKGTSFAVEFVEKKYYKLKMLCLFVKQIP